VLARLVAEEPGGAGAGEPGDDVALGRIQQLGAQAVAAAVLEVGGEQVVDEELAVAAALAELDLDEDVRGVVKDGPSPRARPGRAGLPGQSHLRCRFFFLLMVTGSFEKRSSCRGSSG
jgi:hypothetical protein